ncbi:MAG TPA: magnesium transporter CorA family protein [Bryobacteraceae bacterium]|nr:magnesium transporter CorA family protein [Bryobacteraceae bacterium]
MIWHDIRDPQDPVLDELATKYGLHPLHIEDCRHRNQSAKLEAQSGYLFMVFKTMTMNDTFEVSTGDLDFFVGSDFLITVQETSCGPVSTMLDRTHALEERLRPDQLMHRIVDQLVDSYFPLLDQISDRMDTIEDDVIQCPEQNMLEQIFDLKRGLVEKRRVLVNTRDVIGHLLRNEYSVIQKDSIPFLRDVYDHVVRSLDNVEIHRDLLTSTTELYLTSVANRTNQVMKALTVFGAVSTPALVITGLYGMNLKYLPFADHPHSWGIVLTMIATVSGSVLLLLRKLRWL